MSVTPALETHSTAKQAGTSLRNLARLALSRPALALPSFFLTLIAVATLWPVYLQQPIHCWQIRYRLNCRLWQNIGLAPIIWAATCFHAWFTVRGYSVLIGFSAVAIGAIAGSILGLLAGLSRGLVDEAISRFLDVVSSFPDLLLALVFISFTGPGTVNLIFALAVAIIPRLARVVRAQTFVIAQSGYVEQAKTFGLKRHILVLRHVLPHAIAQVPILATIGLGTAIISAAGLIFLGMGPQPPTPEWGAMLSEARNYLRVAWWIGVWPGLAITLTVISISVLGLRWQLAFEGRRQS